MEAIEHSLGHWARDGLGYWTARLREGLPGLAAGSVVGTGGCALRVGTSWWNLYYRLTPPAWGLGLAAELATAAIDAAHTVDPDRPVIAYLLEHNARSRGRAEKAGLSLVWRGPDAGNPDPDAVRLVYADRPLTPELLDRVTAHP
jgi:RimJ/RimL family protein N-acetyltransferase